MGPYVASQMVKAMLKKQIEVKGARVLVMGLAFKENCPDIRNSRVVDVISELTTYGIDVDVYDPWVDPDEVRNTYGIELVVPPGKAEYDGIVLAVAHQCFKEMGVEEIRAMGKQAHALYDLKHALDINASDLRL